jgi:hypothetical protein
MIVVVVMGMVVRLFDSLRAPREVEVPMGCGVGVAVDAAAVAVH